jgi:hypothetical protein
MLSEQVPLMLMHAERDANDFDAFDMHCRSHRSTPADDLQQQQPCSLRCCVAAAAGCWALEAPRATAGLTNDRLQLLLLLLTHHMCRAAAAAAATATLPPARQERHCKGVKQYTVQARMLVNVLFVVGGET